jgi:lipoprotein-releasing system permease protein
MLAYQLQVGVGDTVTVMIPDSASGGLAIIVPRLRELRSRGNFRSGFAGARQRAGARQSRGRRGASRPGCGPTGIRLKFDDVLKAPSLARCAAARLPPGLQVRDWTQENEAYFRAIRIEKTMMGLILMLIVAVAVFNIVATLVMVVSDKRTDIAILRTLGMSPRGIIAVFMTQGVLIGWIGTLIGVALGVSLALHVASVCQFLEQHLAFTSWTIRTSTTRSGLPSEVHPGDVVRIAVAALLLTFFATVYPA